LAHSIRSALDSGIFAQVHVSTDDAEIAAIATEYGAEVIARPAELAQSETPTAPVVEHALGWWEREREAMPQRIFLLEPTSPFRSAQDIREAATLLDRDDCDAVMGVFAADDPPQWGLRVDAAGLLAPASSWEHYMCRRQDLPPTYIAGPLYAIETAAFLEHGRFLTDRTRSLVVPRLRAIDIDTEADFLFAEFLAAHGDAVEAVIPS
jgi:CMP-N-acetylneuraminic acid synthetase